MSAIHLSSEEDVELLPNVTVEIFRNAIEVPEVEWRRVTAQESHTLSLHFLNAIERALGPELQFRYALVYVDGVPEAAVYTQLLAFTEEDLARITPEGKVGALVERSQNRDNRLALRVLVSGNVLVSGPGIAFRRQPTAPDPLHLVGEALKAIEQSENQPIDLIIFKDLCSETAAIARGPLTRQGFRELSNHPAMLLSLPAGWRDFRDYLNAMSSKYRRRARSSRKRGRELRRIKLSVDQIALHSNRIQEMFETVADQSDWPLHHGRQSLWIELKRALPRRFDIQGYFKDERLIGFAASFSLDTGLEAIAVGIDYTYNRETALYLNMLYDFVELALSQHLPAVRLGRTALEIKSTIGATAENLAVFFKFRDPALEAALEPLVDRLSASVDWTPRKPFKYREITRIQSV